MNNKDKLTKLAEQLLEKEVIFRDDLEVIFGKRPFEKEEIVIEDTVKKVEEKVVELTDTTTPQAKGPDPIV